jgi:predicted DNA repair protein MutK
MYTSVLQWNFAETDLWAKHIVHFIELFIKTFAFNLIIPILVASAAYMYYSLSEILTADHLKHSITLVGNRLTKNSKS